jgi:amino acid transporter
MFALGREKLLPSRLGGLHSIHLSPHIASLSQTTFNAIVVTVFVVLGLDPYIGLASTMIGLGTTGIVLLQALAGMAVVAFFIARGSGHWFTTRLAPALGSLGCFVAVVLTAAHFSVLTNSSSAILNRLPMIYPVALVAGVIFGTYLKRNRADVYSGIAGDEVRNILMGVGINDE